MGDAMNAARLRLGLRWTEVAEQAGISDATLRAIRSGQHPRDLSAAGIERALGWEPGTVAQLLGGTEPATPVTVHVHGEGEVVSIVDTGDRTQVLEALALVAKQLSLLVEALARMEEPHDRGA